MTGKTHQIIGLSAGLAAYLATAPAAYGPATLGASVVAAHFFSLLPDIDQPGSTLWRSLPGGRILGELADPFLEHRNLTHSLLGAALLAWGWHALLGILPPYWGIDGRVLFPVGMAAYFSHLLADMVTVEGIPLLFPYQRSYGLPPRPFEGARILTGKWFENLVVFPLANLALALLVLRSLPALRLALLQ